MSPVPIALLLPLLPGIIESAAALVKAIRASGEEIPDAEVADLLDRIEERLDTTLAEVAALPIRTVPEEEEP